MSGFIKLRRNTPSRLIAKAGGPGTFAGNKTATRVDPKSANSVTTDGLAWLHRNAPSVTAGTQFTFSGWFNMSDAQLGQQINMMFHSNDALGSRLYYNRRPTSNIIRAFGADGSGQTSFSMNQTALWTETGQWFHFCWSADGPNELFKLYINGQPGAFSVGAQNPTDVTVRPRQAFLADWTGGNSFIGSCGEIWFANEYVDLDNGGINKFISTEGKPADLGSRGELPTGTIPDVYFGGDMTADTGGAVGAVPGTGWNGGCNNGSLGDFVKDGASAFVDNV